MINNSDNEQVVYIKFQTLDGSLQIARHARPGLPSPDENIDDYIRDIVHEYKANPNFTYLGIADEDEYDAFMRLKSDHRA